MSLRAARGGPLPTSQDSLAHLACAHSVLGSEPWDCVEVRLPRGSFRTSVLFLLNGPPRGPFPPHQRPGLGKQPLTLAPWLLSSFPNSPQRPWTISFPFEKKMQEKQNQPLSNCKAVHDCLAAHQRKSRHWCQPLQALALTPSSPHSPPSSRPF